MINAATLYAQLEKNTKLDNPFLVSHTHQYSYQDLFDHIQLMCDIFEKFKIQKQDRVGLWTESPFWHAVICWSAMLTGVTIVVVPAMKSTHESVKLAQAFKCKICIYDENEVTYLEDCNRSKLSRFFFNEKKLSLAKLLPAAKSKKPIYETKAGDTAFVVFSSGTTGKQKGIRWSYKALLTHLETNIRLFNYQPAMALCNGLSLEHTDGFFNGHLICALSGMTWIRPDKFSLNHLPNWNELMSRHRAEVLIGVPSMFDMLLYADSKNDGTSALNAFANLNCILSVADKLKPSTWQMLESRYTKVGNMYGLSETVNGGIYALPGDADNFETVGFPVDLEAKIVGEQGETLCVTQQGILAVKGDSLFDGYETEDGFEHIALHDGWFHTSDFAMQQPNGRFQILGRTGEARNIGGLLVHPNEVDAWLQTMPTIKASKSIFVKPSSGMLEELLVSFLVTTDLVDIEQIKKFLASKLESQKIPRDILQIEQLPVSVAGKVDKFALTQRYNSRARQSNQTEHTHGVANQVLSIAANVLGLPVEQLNLDSAHAETMSWDSFGHINLALAIESHFGIKFTFDEVTHMQTLGEFFYNIMEKTQEANI